MTTIAIIFGAAEILIIAAVVIGLLRKERQRRARLERRLRGVSWIDAGHNSL
jgi:hypothetical protein